MGFGFWNPFYNCIYVIIIWIYAYYHLIGLKESKSQQLPEGQSPVTIDPISSDEEEDWEREITRYLSNNINKRHLFQSYLSSPIEDRLAQGYKILDVGWV